MVTLLALILATSTPAEAGGSQIGGANPFGLGLVLGDPTGLSAKLYLGGPKNALDFALAVNTYGWYQDYLYFHCTYLWHPSILASGSGVELPWHVGIGGFLVSNRWNNRFGYDDGLGLRVPIGLDANLTSVPLQFFGDIALMVGVLGDTTGRDWGRIGLSLGIGGRYYF